MERNIDRNYNKSDVCSDVMELYRVEDELFRDSYGSTRAVVTAKCTTSRLVPSHVTAGTQGMRTEHRQGGVRKTST